MSNDQPTTNPFITPIILQVSPEIDQLKAALEFIQDQFSWELKPNSSQLQIINQEKEVIPIEAIRNLISELAYAPRLGKKRAFIFLAADQFSIAAQHAFLKSLEEPPTGTLLLLVSASIDKLLPTIRSRCLLSNHQSTTQIFLHQELPPILTKLIKNPLNVKHYELIDLAAEYKDRDQALMIVNQLLVNLRQSSISTAKTVIIQKNILQTLNYLQANANVRLALESCFFELKNTLQ